MKNCFKCGESKPISEFYKHPMMADGHLGKCKNCNKKDTKERIERVKHDPDWREKERARCRDKMNKRRALGLDKQDRGYQKRWQKRHPQKRSAQLAAYKAFKRGLILRDPVCSECKEDVPLQMHHPDYSKPLEIQWLCVKCHGKAHRKSKYQPMGKAA